MKRVMLVLSSLLIVLTLAACSKSDRTSSTTSPSDNQMASKGPTASDQPTNEADTKVAQDIRQALTSDSSLSTAAQNVTVVASNGTVTLRGSVKDSSEKQKVADKAMQVAGVSNVDNQLTVTQ